MLPASTAAIPNAAVVPEGPLIPPINFAMVAPGVYRSGYPTKKNFPFLAKVGIRSIIYLCPEEYMDANKLFSEEQGITFFPCGVEGNKEPFVDIPDKVIQKALSYILDVRNHPILIHCNKGKHRTGTLVGCLRKLQGWSLTACFDEYNRYAGSKGRAADQQYIELFDTDVAWDPAYIPQWFNPRTAPLARRHRLATSSA
eukprot:TRINITY_DN55457_c0_g1_i1.p1 TRINITY_DN55457_c0_g1~~TRINITY_DN55457_c0_g1_i1.p1  ORF type:complete len:199 (+),score=36.08 TRINITY_DN55457_c0_g1_i1:56-652(+)